MPKATLFTDSGNFKILKILIAAKYADIEIEIPPFRLGKDNMTIDFLAVSPLGRVPVLETDEGTIFDSIAITRYLCGQQRRANLMGSTVFKTSQIDLWTDFCRHDIELPVSVWIYPILGLRDYNPDRAAAAKEDLTRALKIIDEHLDGKVFMVANTVSLAEIALISALVFPFKFVADEEYRSQFPNVMRWFHMCLEIPEFKEVIGEVELAVTEMTVPTSTSNLNLAGMVFPPPPEDDDSYAGEPQEFLGFEMEENPISARRGSVVNTSNRSLGKIKLSRQGSGNMMRSGSATSMSSETSGEKEGMVKAVPSSQAIMELGAESREEGDAQDPSEEVKDGNEVIEGGTEEQKEVEEGEEVQDNEEQNKEVEEVEGQEVTAEEEQTVEEQTAKEVSEDQTEEQIEEQAVKQAEEQAEEQTEEQAVEQAEEKAEEQTEEQTEEQVEEQDEEQNEEVSGEQADVQADEQVEEQAEEQEEGEEEVEYEEVEEGEEDQPEEQTEEQGEEEQVEEGEQEVEGEAEEEQVEEGQEEETEEQEEGEEGEEVEYEEVEEEEGEEEEEQVEEGEEQVEEGEEQVEEEEEEEVEYEEVEEEEEEEEEGEEGEEGEEQEEDVEYEEVEEEEEEEEEEEVEYEEVEEEEEEEEEAEGEDGKSEKKKSFVVKKKSFGDKKKSFGDKKKSFGEKKKSFGEKKKSITEKEDTPEEKERKAKLAQLHKKPEGPTPFTTQLNHAPSEEVEGPMASPNAFILSFSESGLCLEAENDARVWMVPQDEESEMQQWRLTSEGYLECCANGLVLDLDASNIPCLSQKSGSALQIWEYNEKQEFVNQGNGLVLASDSEEERSRLLMVVSGSKRPQVWEMNYIGMYLECMLNKNVLTIKRSNEEPGAEVWFHPKKGLPGQQWILTLDGYMESCLNGLVLSIEDGSEEIKANLVMMEKTGDLWQQWRLTEEGYLQSELNDMVLAVVGGMSGVCMYTKNDTENQKWVMKAL